MTTCQTVGKYSDILTYMSQRKYYYDIFSAVNTNSVYSMQLLHKNQFVYQGVQHLKRSFIVYAYSCRLIRRWVLYLKISQYFLLACLKKIWCLFSVKNKFSHAYPQEYPYRINSVLECEFFLLEMMVKIHVVLCCLFFCSFFFQIVSLNSENPHLHNNSSLVF